MLYTHFKKLSEEDLRIYNFHSVITQIYKVNCPSVRENHCNYFAACEILQAFKVHSHFDKLLFYSFSKQ